MTDSAQVSSRPHCAPAAMADDDMPDSADQGSAVGSHLSATGVAPPAASGTTSDADGHAAAESAAVSAPGTPSPAASAAATVVTATPKSWRTLIEGPPLSRKSSRSHKRKKFDDEILVSPHVEKRKKTPKDKTDKSPAVHPSAHDEAAVPMAVLSAAGEAFVSEFESDAGAAGPDVVGTVPVVPTPTSSHATAPASGTHTSKRSKGDGPKRSRAPSKSGRSNSGSGSGTHHRHPTHDERIKPEPSAVMTAPVAAGAPYGAPRHRESDRPSAGYGGSAAASVPQPAYVPPPLVVPNVIRGDREAQRWTPEDDYRLLVNMEQVCFILI